MVFVEARLQSLFPHGAEGSGSSKVQDEHIIRSRFQGPATEPLMAFNPGTDDVNCFHCPKILLDMAAEERSLPITVMRLCDQSAVNSILVPRGLVNPRSARST